MTRRFSRRVISALLNMSSFEPGTVRSFPEEYMLIFCSNLNTPYLATPEATKEVICGPTDGMTAGESDIEYRRLSAMLPGEYEIDLYLP